MTRSEPNTSPTAFISYSWDSPEHKKWTKELATRLRADGVDVALDQWKVVPGDQLPRFMETAVRENNYVLILCTPNYKAKADKRAGGVGYEGDIMTAEVLAKRNHRKFIPILRTGTPGDAVPSWLGGKYWVDFSGDPYSEDAYRDLLVTLHDRREQAPPIGRPRAHSKPIPGDAKPPSINKDEMDADFELIQIVGVLIDEVGDPRNDGTRGCALYTVPLKLCRVPSHEWNELFSQTWDHPPHFTTMHRPGIARVQGDRIVLDGTTIEELRDTHRETLKIVLQKVNTDIAEMVHKRRSAAESEARRQQAHRDNVRDVGGAMTF